MATIAHRPRAAPPAAAARAGTRTPAREVRIRPVPAVRRAAAILQLLARHGGGLTVSQIARQLGIVPSTCLHIMRELVTAHLVAFEPNGKVYRLGLEILGLASELSLHDAFIQSAQPRLAQFAHDFGVSASAQQRDGDEVVVVAAVVAAEGLASPVGRRFPCFSAAAGRLYASAATWSDAERHAHFERVRWQNRPDFDDWMAEVRLARTRGYAIDEGQFRLGVTSIAAGIADSQGEILRTISINVVSAQMEGKRRASFVRALERMAGEIASAFR